MKKTQNILAIFLIIATLILLLPTMVKAESNGTSSITISGSIGGKKLQVYRVLNYDEGNQNYTFDSNDGDTEEQKAQMEASKKFFFEKGFDVNGEHVAFSNVVELTEWLKKHTNSQDVLMSMSEQYYNFAKDSANNLTPVETIDLTGQTEVTTYTVTNIKSGYYLIYDVTEQANLGSTSKSAPMLSIVPLPCENTSIQVKADTIPTPDKTVTPTTQAIGKNVTYTVNSIVPKMIGYTTYTFNMLDQLSSGLDFINGSETIKITKEGKEDVTLVQGRDYTLNYDEATRKLTINMVDFIKWRNDYADGTITATYEAKLNANAVKPGSTINSVKIEYSNDPTTTEMGKTEPSTVEVKVYNLQFTKKNSDGEVLEGAGFSLFEQGNDRAIEFDKTTGVIATDDTSAENRTTVIYSDANGLFSFKGLKDGVYNLKEVNVSDENKYALPKFEMVINLTAEVGENSVPTLSYTNQKNNEKGYLTPTGVLVEKEDITLNEMLIQNTTRYTLTADVLNTLKDSLPSTGGMGTVIFTVAGIAIMAGSAVMFIINKKKEA